MFPYSALIKLCNFTSTAASSEHMPTWWCLRGNGTFTRPDMYPTYNYPNPYTRLTFIQRHIPERHLPDQTFTRPDIYPTWHLPDWHLPDWHLPDWHLPDWHLPDWHLPDRHLPDWHLPDYITPTDTYTNEMYQNGGVEKIHVRRVYISKLVNLLFCLFCLYMDIIFLFFGILFAWVSISHVENVQLFLIWGTPLGTCGP